jgi:cytochrome c nitrite reductase small subunit
MRKVLILAAALVGVLVGIGGYTFVYAKGYSYLTNDPVACANCHVMRDHFSAWTKARNGFWHSFYFTTGRYPDPLRITFRNHEVTERACRKCHTELTAAIDPAHVENVRGGLTCTRCHNDVGHIE